MFSFRPSRCDYNAYEKDNTVHPESEIHKYGQLKIFPEGYLTYMMSVSDPLTLPRISNDMYKIKKWCEEIYELSRE